MRKIQEFLFIIFVIISICYSANIGGTGTIIGTPPNLILMEFMSRFSDHPLNFGSWMMFSLPEVFLNLGLLWIILQLYFLQPSIKQVFKSKKESKNADGVMNILAEKYQSLGSITFHEITTLVLFNILVIIWFFRKPGFMPGWAELLQWSKPDGRLKTTGI